MAKALTSAVVTAATFAAAIATNPSPDAHREKIRGATAEHSPVAAALGLGVVKAFVSSYHSLGVASYTTAHESVVSWGAFGMVFVSDRPLGEK